MAFLDSGVVQITSIGGMTRIGPLPAHLTVVLRALEAQPQRIDRHSDGLAATLARCGLDADAKPIAQADKLIGQLARLGALTLTLASHAADDAVEIEFEPYKVGRFAAAKRADSDDAWTLRDGCFLRSEHGALVCEAPDGSARIRAHASALSAAFGRFAGRHVPATESGPGSIASPQPQALLEALFVRAGLAVPAARDAPANARDDGAHRWEFHDRLFHMRSRIGFHTAAVGPTFRFADREGPLPLYKPVASERHIALTAPSADTLPTVSLADALETRQSRRTYASDPVTRDELSTFLFLSCRVKSEVRVADAQPADGPQTAYDWSRRPSPSGGGCHSLEVYLLIERCQGVDPGVYHYDPEAHRLHVLDAPEGVRRSMLLQAQYLNGEQAMPDVLIVLASRFGRMNWKYESMAYATVLKDAGALLQTLYLACEATGLAGTAVGAGSIVDFQRLIGVPVTEESSVAEFLLGRPMADAE